MGLNKRDLFVVGGIVVILIVEIFLLIKEETDNIDQIVETENIRDFELISEEESEQRVTPITKTEIQSITIVPTFEPTLILTPTPTLTPTSRSIYNNENTGDLNKKPTVSPTKKPIPTGDNSIKATGVSLNLTEITLEIGKKRKILAKIEPNETSNKTIIWSSENGNIARVDNNGWITGINKGIVRITAETSNGMTNSVKVYINPDSVNTPILKQTPTPNKINPEGIILNYNNLTLKINDMKQIRANIIPVNTTNWSIAWSSSDANVATINTNGLITAKNSGTAIITAKTFSNITKTVIVTVLGTVTPIVTIKPTGTTPMVTKTPTPTPTLTPTPTPTPAKIAVYTFIYDENNTKPKMACGTYTVADRARLEDLLKQTVNKAGRGTRAGVVAAARFLVGGLDYRVPYLGPKKVDYSLGRYPYLGLNIGNSKAWGCSVSGYTQGMDCTNFVDWAIINGGLNTGTVNPHIKVSVLADNVSDVKVGDFLLTLSDGSVSWTYSHTAIIIGEDDNYFYVAEEKGAGNRVIKISKTNPPSRKQGYGIVSMNKYPAEGNLTEMWNE